MTSAPGRSTPRTASRKNSRSGFTSASFAKYVRRCPSGSRFEKKGGTRRGTGRAAVTSPLVALLKDRLRVGRCRSSMYSCSNAKIWRSPARRLMIPICRPCRRTASVLSFFVSNFIFALRRFLLVVGVTIERALFTLALLVVPEMVADERLHGRNEGAGDHEEVAVEDTDEFEEGVVARHNLAGLDAGDVHLGQTETASQLPLAPAAADARILQLPAHVLRKALWTQRFDMLCYIFPHA